jgi:hypothetical protein
MRNGWMLGVAMVAACKGEPEVEAPELHACESIGSAGTAITASADRDSAPAIAVGETPFTVSLVDGAVGWVSVEITEDTPALLFAGTADVVSAVWHNGMEETLPTGAPNEECADDIPEHFDLDLHEGSWQIGVGPAGVSEVWLMLISAAGHAHEGE